MKVLYITSMVSDKLFDILYSKRLTTGFVGQKYHGLFVKGLSSADDDCEVIALSQPPIGKSFCRFKDVELGIKFRYVPIVSIPLIKQLVYFIYTFIYTLYWCVKNIGEEKVIMSSLMRVYQYPPIWLGSCLFRCKQITIACDVPWMTTVQVTTSKLSVKQRISIWLGKTMCGMFDGYVFLTDTMNDVLNPNKRPFIVVEGFCDQNMANVPNTLENKEGKRIIMYAGGLNHKYGIGNLVEAVKRLEDDSVELWLYGLGDMNSSLRDGSSKNIKFKGPRSNEEVVSAELKASVLINPRPTEDEYTRYSFPSKTLEYMASGTYTMTTRLAGIPSEYFDYCGVIDDYSAEGIAAALRETLKMSASQLHEKGMAAKAFVLENKNNKKQAQRVIVFAHELK